MIGDAPLYPVNVDLAGRRILLVGAGTVASRKLDGLLESGGRVTVVAPEATDRISDLDAEGRLRWHQRPYRRGEVASYRLAMTTTGRAEVDRQVFLDADAAGVLVNSADDVANCDFTLPAVVRRGDVTVAIATNGRSPALAAWLRRRLDNEADLWHALAESAGRVRDEIRSSGRSSELPGWSEAIDAAAAVIRQHLGEAATGADRDGEAA